MATYNFRQGIVSSKQTSTGSANFIDISQNKISILSSVEEPLILNFAHKDTDYIFNITNNISDFFVITQNPQPTLYVIAEVSTTTGLVDIYTTELIPLEQDNEPTSPQTGQIWFSPTTATSHKYTGTSWTEGIRLQLGSYTPGQAVIYQPYGTQAGLNDTITAGSVLFDQSNKPIKNAKYGTFYTTTTEFISGISNHTTLSFESNSSDLIAGEPIPKYHLVTIDSNGKAKLANVSAPNMQAVGLTNSESLTDQYISIRTNGFVVNPLWNFSNTDIGKEIFLGTDGTLIPRNNLSTQMRLQQVGTVYNKNSILLDIRPLIEFDNTGNLVDVMIDRSTGTFHAKDVNSASTGSTSSVPAGFTNTIGYTYIQGTASETWTITLPATYNPIGMLVQVFDDNNKVVIPNQITTNNTTRTVVINFIGTIKGTAVITIV